MGSIIFLIYMIAGYWAVGQTVYRNKVVIYSSSIGFWGWKLLLGTVFGFILIPVAIILNILNK